ncbi:MAG: preprotein translocase subunit SecA [Candidatus Spechtbacterales bacterium]
MAFLEKILGDPNERALNKLRLIVDEVNDLEKNVAKLSKEELKEKTLQLKGRLKKEETLDDILPQAFAAAREAAKRTLGQRHYDVQLLGGMVLHQGKISEMKTGEGKTLSATAPIYLNALAGQGVHVVTVNDYLAKRDVVWMGQIYNALGISVGCIVHDAAYVYDEKYAKERSASTDLSAVPTEQAEASAGGQDLDETRDTLGMFKVEDEFLRPVERKEAYAADITYGTNNEFGFDYLRDNLTRTAEDKVQRGHNFAVVDEIDSILIDEARTPLIISAPDKVSTELYEKFSKIVPALKENTDYNVDYKLKAVSITEEGITKVERALGIKNLYDPSEGGEIKYAYNLEQALKAQILFTRDKDYVVKEGEVIIVDEFTGRLMPGRRYSQGLHQAIEAKEGVRIREESKTLASITFQNYFRMYKKLSGMTGTALTSAEEFDRVYKLDIVAVPTNKPLVRKEMPDLVFRSKEGKYKALTRDIAERHKAGQPVLVGTTSIEKNEYLSALLQKEGIKHEILNAKNHEREGQIIAQAGRKGAVTVATNMAGRGVDIILGGNPPDAKEAEKIKNVGGLHVIGTERHEARRIDNQLRGRAGRQGDPGSSQFHLSLDDEILKVFGGDRIHRLMDTLNMPEDMPIESKMVSGAIESAQSKIEGMNFDTRKHLLDYDEVLNKHREAVYKKRDAVLEAKPEDREQMILGYLESYIEKMSGHYIASDHPGDWNLEELYEDIKSIVPEAGDLHEKLEVVRKEGADRDAAVQKIKNLVFDFVSEAYEKREKESGAEAMRAVEKWILLRTIDMLWTDHLEGMNHLRDNVRLRAYAQRDPLVEYKNEGIQLFNKLLDTIEAEIAHNIFKVHVHADAIPHKVAENVVERHEARGQGQTDIERKSEDTSKKIGRNEPCWCGSGKKYKKCHGA